MVDHLQSRGTPWRQCTSHEKVPRHFIANGFISNPHLQQFLSDLSGWGVKIYE